PAIVSCAASTTQRVAPSGASRASSAPAPAPFANGVADGCSVSVPPAAIENVEMVALAVFTAKSQWPSWLISTQHGAVWRLANGEPVTEASAPFAAAEYAE